MKNKTLLFSVLMTILPVFMMAQSGLKVSNSWYEVGQGGFTATDSYYQHIAIDGTVPYVAFTDPDHDKKVTIMKYSGGTWQVVGTAGFTEGPVSNLDFKIENGQFFLAYAANNKITVMNLMGGQWQNVGSPQFASSEIVSLAVAAGIPYVAFQDRDNGYKITVESFSGTKWEVVGKPGFSTCSLPNVIDIAVFDDIYVVYRDVDDYYTRATAMVFHNNTWSVLGSPDFSGGTLDGYDFLTTINNTPYVVGWDKEAKATVYKYNSTDWEIVGNPGISDGQAVYTSITSAADGTLYIAYLDDNDNKVHVKTLSNNKWESVGGVVSKSKANLIDITTDNNGKPYVVYQDNWYSRKTTVMAYGSTAAVNNINAASQFTVSPNPTTGKIQIHVDGSNQPTKIEVLNSLGQVVMKPAKGLLKMDLSTLNEGLYFIRINDNKQEYIRKVILQKQ